MTEPTPTPDPTAPAAAAPPAKKKGGRVVGIIVMVIVAGVVAGLVRIGLNALGGDPTAKYSVGACVDQLPLGSLTSGAVPSVVDCSGTSAKGKIVATFDDKHFADAETLCPATAVSVVELLVSGGGSKLLCLSEV